MFRSILNFDITRRRGLIRKIGRPNRDSDCNENFLEMQHMHRAVTMHAVTAHESEGVVPPRLSGV